MRPVLRRIAIHGGFTALLLGIMGLLFVEAAGIWMVPMAATRSAVKIAPPDPIELRSRIPLLMAAWGFAFVAVGELLVYRFRKNRTPPAPALSNREETERLLQELLAQVEGKAKAGNSASQGPNEGATSMP